MANNTVIVDVCRLFWRLFRRCNVCLTARFAISYFMQNFDQDYCTVSMT